MPLTGLLLADSENSKVAHDLPPSVPHLGSVNKKALRREGLRAFVESEPQLGPVTSLLSLADTRAVARRCLVVAETDHKSQEARYASFALRVVP